VDYRKIVARHLGVHPQDPRVEAHPLMKLALDLPEGRGVEIGSPHSSVNPENWHGAKWYAEALRGGPPVQSAEWDGNLVVPSQRLIDVCKEILKLNFVYLFHTPTGTTKVVLSNDQSAVMIALREKGMSAYCTMTTISEGDLQKGRQLFDRMLAPDDPRKGIVFVLATTMQGYTIRRLGLAGTPIERSNYSQQVLEDYDHVVSDFQTESPCGRLVILSGEPGTGKTYLVRSFLTEVPKAAFILIPPHIVQDLAGPDILPALTQAKDEMSGPIILVIEDADSCLVPREDGSINTISSLLNLGDGIMGSILDIRILTTTNAHKIKMDPATRREGRLCRHMQVDALSPEEATNVYQRLLPGQKATFKEPTTLAKVYGKARREGWEPPKATPAKPEMKPYL
jgi:hypothetical protein